MNVTKTESTMKEPKKGFIFYPTVEEFCKDPTNNRLLKTCVISYFKGNVSKEDIEDIIAFIFERTLKYNTLSGFLPEKSSFYTYFSNHVNCSIKTFWRIHMKERGNISHKEDSGYSKCKIISNKIDKWYATVDESYERREELYAFKQFILWYKMQLNSNANTLCRKERAKKILTVLRHTMNGFSKTEVSIVMGINIKLVSQLLLEVKENYRTFLKTVL